MVASARKSTILRPQAIVFSAGASATPLIRNLSAAIRWAIRTVVGSTVIMIAVMAKSSWIPSGVWVIPCCSSQRVTPG